MKRKLLSLFLAFFCLTGAGCGGGGSMASGFMDDKVVIFGLITLPLWYPVYAISECFDEAGKSQEAKEEYLNATFPESYQKTWPSIAATKNPQTRYAKALAKIKEDPPAANDARTGAIYTDMAAFAAVTPDHDQPLAEARALLNGNSNPNNALLASALLRGVIDANGLWPLPPAPEELASYQDEDYYHLEWLVKYYDLMRNVPSQALNNPAFQAVLPLMLQAAEQASPALPKNAANNLSLAATYDFMARLEPANPKSGAWRTEALALYRQVVLSKDKLRASSALYMASALLKNDEERLALLTEFCTHNLAFGAFNANWFFNRKGAVKGQILQHPYPDFFFIREIYVEVDFPMPGFAPMLADTYTTPKNIKLMCDMLAKNLRSDYQDIYYMVYAYSLKGKNADLLSTPQQRQMSEQMGNTPEDEKEKKLLRLQCVNRFTNALLTGNRTTWDVLTADAATSRCNFNDIKQDLTLFGKYLYAKGIN